MKSCARLLIAAGCFIAAPLCAAESYFGLKAGTMAADSADMEAGANAGMFIGYGRGPLGLEGEITTSLRSADTAQSDTDWKITTLALYATYRSGGEVYLKVKGGVLYEQVNFDVGGISLQDHDTGASAGIGLGWRRGGSRVEVEYTRVERDIAMISVGYAF